MQHRRHFFQLAKIMIHKVGVTLVVKIGSFAKPQITKALQIIPQLT